MGHFFRYKLVTVAASPDFLLPRLIVLTEEILNTMHAQKRHASRLSNSLNNVFSN